MWNRNSQGKFKIEHTLDEMNNVRGTKDRSSANSISTISRLNLVCNEETEFPSLMEKPSEKKGRKRSHWVVYLTTLNITIGFSIVLTGVYPYLKLLADDPNLSKVKSGIVIACNPLGQLIASPIAGYAGNKLGGIRYVCYFTMTLFALGSLLYGMLPALDSLWTDSAFHLMMVARFIVGVASANITLCRSYIAQSTTLKERTPAISLVSAAQALGFIIGPALQVVLNLTLEEDMTKYRSAGFIAVIMAVGNIIILTPFVFTEYDIAAKEREMLGKTTSGGAGSVLPKIDYLALMGVLFGFFLIQFVYVLVESLMEPLVLDQYAWCDNMAVIVVGVCLMIGGVLTIFMFILAPRISKKIGDRKVLGIGFIVCTIGLFLFIPWGPNELKYCRETDEITTTALPFSTTEKFFNNDYAKFNIHTTTDITATSDPGTTSIYDTRTDMFDKLCVNITYCLGCPPKQDWCENTPQLPFPQFFTAFLVLICGYPFGLSMSNSIFSKLIGPRPQGTWMGILTSTGSFARVLGPIFVSLVYANLGTIYTFGILVVAMLVGIAELLILYRRLVPMKLPTKDDADKF